MSGKGDNRRPQFVDDEELDENWVRTFRRDKKNHTKMRHKPKLRGQQKHINGQDEGDGDEI